MPSEACVRSQNDLSLGSLGKKHHHNEKSLVSAYFKGTDAL